MDAELEKAQAQAMEALLQQCVAAPSDGQVVSVTAGEANATLFQFLSQSCEDASAAVGQMRVEDVAARLAEAVAATQASLKDVRASAAEILQDPEKVRELGEHLRSADATLMEMLHASANAMIEAEGGEGQGQQSLGEMAVSRPPQGGQLAALSDEDGVRNMMLLADNMCATMDHALSTISKDELDLAAQLSLGLSQKLLEAGQSLFMSLSKEERRKARRQTRGDHISIEELPSDYEGDEDKDDCYDGAVDDDQEQQPRPNPAVLRKKLDKLMLHAREHAAGHPYLTGALTAAGLPFVGLAIPVASIIGVGLVVEKYYPEHTAVALDLGANFIQMSKLWFLLLKIGARQLAVVARDCFQSWYAYASANGFVATGVELASAGCSLGALGVAFLYRTAATYAQRALQ